MNPDELTSVSDSGDKSAGSRFERCLRRPQRGEARDGRVTSAANNAAASRAQGSDPKHAAIIYGSILLMNHFQIRLWIQIGK